MSDKEEFVGTAIASEGLWQRLNLICMYLPLFIVAVKGINKRHLNGVGRCPKSIVKGVILWYNILHKN
jgi:hypothetical protein